MRKGYAIQREAAASKYANNEMACCKKNSRATNKIPKSFRHSIQRFLTSHHDAGKPFIFTPKTMCTRALSASMKKRLDSYVLTPDLLLLVR